MSSKAEFLRQIRERQPAPTPLPEVPFFDCQPGRGVDLFNDAFIACGGRIEELLSGCSLDTWIEQRFGTGIVVASCVSECVGNRMITSQTPQEEVCDVDVSVVRARFGVAETGSLFLGEDEYVVNSIGYLAQHLVVLLDPEKILLGVQDAYLRDDFRTARYAALVTGPSATADIEGVLIHGAQGVRSLSLIFMPERTTQ